jgi:drug/metabolite transporter (DMT)-like permease
MSSNNTRLVNTSSEVMTGLILMFISVLISPVIDIFSKLAITTVPSAQITAARFAVQALCMLPIVLWRRNLADTTWRQSLFHAIRGAIITISMISFVTTLKYMAVADAIAIFFVEPIILTILSSIFLKEAIGWRRYTACGVGFFGAILIIQPSFQEVGYVALLPVVSAVCIAISAMMNRALAQREDPWVMQFHMGLWGLLICAILLYIGHGSGSDVSIPSCRILARGCICSASASPPRSPASSASMPTARHLPRRSHRCNISKSSRRRPLPGWCSVISRMR